MRNSKPFHHLEEAEGGKPGQSTLKAYELWDCQSLDDTVTTTNKIAR
jgi:hypothetical protein